MTVAGLSPELFLYLQEAFAASSALVAARELGIVELLVAGQVFPATVAKERTIGERDARLLLSALAGLGLANVEENGSFSAAIPNLSRLTFLYSQWARLTDTIKAGRPVVMMDTPAGAASIYPDLVPFLEEIFRPVAERVAEHLMAPGLRVLDVGAGTAPWSQALAKRDPTCRVTAVDLPDVLDRTRQVLTVAGLNGQFKLLAGDIFTVDWGESVYDLAIAGNIFHLFDEAANRRLLERIFTAIRRGGRLAILDSIPNEQLDGPRPVVLYALSLLLRTSHGQAYPFSVYQAWLRKAGYHQVERLDWPDSQVSLITAYRPGPQ